MNSWNKSGAHTDTRTQLIWERINGNELFELMSQRQRSKCERLLNNAVIFISAHTRTHPSTPDLFYTTHKSYMQSLSDNKKHVCLKSFRLKPWFKGIFWYNKICNFSVFSCAETKWSLLIRAEDFNGPSALIPLYLEQHVSQKLFLWFPSPGVKTWTDASRRRTRTLMVFMLFLPPWTPLTSPSDSNQVAKWKRCPSWGALPLMLILALPLDKEGGGNTLASLPDVKWVAVETSAKQPAGADLSPLNGSLTSGCNSHHLFFPALTHLNHLGVDWYLPARCAKMVQQQVHFIITLMKQKVNRALKERNPRTVCHLLCDRITKDVRHFRSQW